MGCARSVKTTLQVQGKECVTLFLPSERENPQRKLGAISHAMRGAEPAQKKSREFTFSNSKTGIPFDEGISWAGSAPRVWFTPEQEGVIVTKSQLIELVVLAIKVIMLIIEITVTIR